MTKKELKQRERELTHEIERARDDQRAAKHIDLAKGAGQKQLRHLLAKLAAYIGEKVKNRKNVRRKLRKHGRPRKITKGVDVSSAQGSIDWKKVRAAGYDFAIIKATEGVGYTDPTFSATRLKAMVDAGMAIGAYHFARPDTGGSTADAAAEAHYFVGVVAAAARAAGIPIISPTQMAAGKKGIALFNDFETAPYSTPWFEAFGKTLAGADGKEGAPYGGGYSLNPVLGGLGAYAKFVWLAAYVTDWHLYFNGNDALVHIWQHSSSGQVPGISGNVDLDIYIG
jgi:lysozyme